MTLTEEYALNQFYLSNYHLLPEGTKEVLQEGPIDIAKDATQFALGAAAEYGLVLTVAGAPAGPVVETIVDAAFVSESVASTVSSLQNVADQFEELKTLMSKVMDVDLSAGFEQFYQQIKEIWQDASKFVGEEYRDKIDELVEKTQKTLKKLITKIADAVTDALKLVIPDATIGTAVAETVEAALKALSKSAYSMISGLLDRAGRFKQLLINPGAAKEFFEKAFDWIEETIQKIQEEREKDPEGAIATVMNLARKVNPSTAVADKLGDAAINALSNFVKNNRGNVIDTIMSVVNVVIPSMFAFLASYEILMKGEWKQEEQEEEEEVQEESVRYLMAPLLFA